MRNDLRLLVSQQQVLIAEDQLEKAKAEASLKRTFASLGEEDVPARQLFEGGVGGRMDAEAETQPEKVIKGPQVVASKYQQSLEHRKRKQKKVAHVLLLFIRRGYEGWEENNDGRTLEVPSVRPHRRGKALTHALLCLSLRLLNVNPYSILDEREAATQDLHYRRLRGPVDEPLTLVPAFSGEDQRLQCPGQESEGHPLVQAGSV